mgnify:CR=1 FL=1
MSKHIIDLCCGNAPIPLFLTLKTDAKITGIEIQKEVYELAKESVELNNLSTQIELINDNINNISTKYETDTFDLITCNPPYFKHSENSITNDNMIKSIARHEIHMELEDVFKISKKLLKNGGSICMVHRTDRLMEIIEKHEMLDQVFMLTSMRNCLLHIQKKYPLINLVLLTGDATTTMESVDWCIENKISMDSYYGRLTQEMIDKYKYPYYFYYL